jgi:hypothetical protein
LAFTLKDDQILFDWIAHVEKEDGGTALSGGKVYMALEEIVRKLLLPGESTTQKS